MSVEGRELGWDDSIKQDSQNFDPIPEGDYNVTIEKYDRSRSKGEGKLPPCNMAVVYFIVHGQDRELQFARTISYIAVWNGSCRSCSVVLA